MINNSPGKLTFPHVRTTRLAAIRSMLHAIKIKPLPAGAAPNPASSIKDPAIRREREMAVLRQRVEFDWRV